MSLFDKLKQKSLEKLLQQAAGSADTQKMLQSMGASESDVSGVMQAMKGMNFSTLMGMLKAFTPGEPVTADKIRSVFTSEMLQQMASKLQVPVDQAPEKLAAMINQMMAQRPPAA